MPIICICYNSLLFQIRDYLEKQDPWWPVSPEFLNYALALCVYAVRYPAVFWNTNKGFAFLFSLQLCANTIQVSLKHSHCRAKEKRALSSWHPLKF